MNVEFYNSQLESIDKASGRGRWVLVTAIVTSLAQIGANFNFGFSWLRSFSEDLAFNSGLSKVEAVKEIQLQLLKSWVDQLFVNVSPLGIKFSITDANVIGGIALTVISIWFFYCTRRENHMMGQMLRTVAQEGDQTKAHVFYGICSTQVFGTLTPNDDPVRSVDSSGSGRTLHILRFSTPILFYFPGIALLSTFISDVLSLVSYTSIFRGEQKTLYQVLNDKGTLIGLLPRIGFDLLLEVALIVAVFFLLWRAYDFHRGSVQLLRDALDKGFGKTSPG